MEIKTTNGEGGKMMNKSLCAYHQKKGTWKELYCQLCRSKKAYCGNYPAEEPQEEVNYRENPEHERDIDE